MIKKLNTNIIVGIISALALIAVVVSEKLLGKDPCVLCLYERLPYIAAFFICACSLILKIDHKIVRNILLVVFVASSLLSGYHVALEHGLIESSGVCETNIDYMQDYNKILNMINSSVASDCSKPSYFIAGITFAEMNLALSLMIIALLGLRKDAKIAR